MQGLGNRYIVFHVLRVLYLVTIVSYIGQFGIGNRIVNVVP
jgi:hypothetical protein